MTITPNALHSGIDRRSTGGELPPAPGTGMVAQVGNGSDGRIGSGWFSLSNYMTRPEYTPNLEGVVKVVCAVKATFFLTASGDLYSCGDQNNGELGTGELAGNVAELKHITAFGQAPGESPPKVVDIAARAPVLLVKVADGRVFGCGNPDVYQTGKGYSAGALPRSDPQLSPFELGKGGPGTRLGIPLTGVVDLAPGSVPSEAVMGAGDYNQMFVKNELVMNPVTGKEELASTIWRCGSKFGQSGGSGFPYVTKELRYEWEGAPLVGPKKVVQIEANSETTMLRCEDGTVLIKGQNVTGQLGNGNVEARELRELSGTIVSFEGKTKPGLSTESAHITNVSSFAGLAVGMFIGINPSDSFANQTNAEAFPTSAKITELKAAEGIIVLSAKASQIGAETPIFKISAGTVRKVTTEPANWEPLRKVTLPVGRKAKDIAAAIYNSFVTLDNGEVLSWGYNQEGACGLGHRSGEVIAENKHCVLKPTLVPGITTAVEVAVAGTHFSSGLPGSPTAHILLADGTVRSMGSNQQGQLGDGTLSDRDTPTPLAWSGGIISQIWAGTQGMVGLLPLGTPTLPPLSARPVGETIVVTVRGQLAGSRTQKWKVSATLAESPPSYAGNITTALGSKIVKFTTLPTPWGTAVLGKGVELRSGTLFEHKVGTKTVTTTVLVKEVEGSGGLEWEVENAAISSATATAAIIGQPGGKQLAFTTVVTAANKHEPEESFTISAEQLAAIFGKAVWPNFSHRLEIDVRSEYENGGTFFVPTVTVTYFEDEAATKEVAAGNAKALFAKLTWNPATLDALGLSAPGWWPYRNVPGKKLLQNSLNLTAETIPEALSAATGSYVFPLATGGELVEAAAASAYVDPWNSNSPGRRVEVMPNVALDEPVNVHRPQVVGQYTYVGDTVTPSKPSEWSELDARSTKKVILRRWYRHGPQETDVFEPLTAWLRPGEAGYNGYVVQSTDLGYGISCSELAENDRGISLVEAHSNSTRTVMAAGE